MLSSFVSAIAVTAALPAAAQTAGVAAARDPEIIVTANRAGEAERAEDVPASITVISDQELQNRQTRVVSDVLRDVPGIAVNRTGAIGGFTQIRIRGSESNQSLVLIDGIEGADPFYGEYDLGTVLADPAMRIEVLRGQQSALYGSDAIGGVVQIVTLTGAEAPGVSLRAEGGSQGTASGAARVAGVSGALDYALSATGYTTDGFATARGGTRELGSDNVGANAKLIWSPTANFTLTGVGRYSYTRAETNQTDGDPTSPTFGLTVDTPGEYFTNDGLYGLVKGELALADGRWTNSLTAQIADTRRHNYTGEAETSGDHGARYKGSFVSAYRFDTGAVRHRITGAVDVERESFRNTVASGGAFTGEKHIDTVGIVGQYSLRAGGLALDGSVRRDLNDRFADVTTYRVQAGYRFATGTRLHGAWGTGVRNPGFYELFGYIDGRYIGNPDLAPETSKGWEAGVDQVIAGDKAHVGVTYFDNRLEDEIVTAYPAPDFVATSVNADRLSHRKGVEAFASAQPIPQLRLDLAYTYTDADENGVAEVRRPKHMGSFNLTAFSTDKRLSGTLTVRYNGRMTDIAYTDPSYIPVTKSLQEYVLVNLAAEYRLSERFSVYGRIENLFDEEYEEIFSTLGSPRAAYAGVRAHF
ncbi:TonB-dependent receptor plug domain-containing protein [Stakelama saccharophila]|uniref:TonB-dependent receptor n=1 Tax=Stakelama saccharophila TaxID=3075605 RepID=A0ABZ0B7T5_9SPHN|nr:TonB-dependent receptor [Stakelama sp. W311]WNO53065.1 TonB-dependent receptor [Stakelama sp. W311]